jgi:hypothetical protein
MDASQHAPVPSDARSASSSEALAPESSRNDSKPITAKAETARRIGRIAGQWFAALSAFTLAAGLYLSTYQLNVSFRIFLWALGIVALPFVLVSGVTWALVVLQGGRKLAGLALVSLVCATYVRLPLTKVGLRLATLVSRPALNALAERVRAGESIETPTLAGLFVVHEIKTEGPVVALVFVDQPSGDSALVHFPDGPRVDAAIHRFGSQAFYGPMYNLNWDVALGGGWRYQDED